MRYVLVRWKKNILKGVLEYMVHGSVHECCNTMADMMGEKKGKNVPFVLQPFPPCHFLVISK